MKEKRKLMKMRKIFKRLIRKCTMKVSNLSKLIKNSGRKSKN